MRLVEQRNLTLSTVLHIVVLLVAVFGLPALLPDAPEPQPMVMTVDILPISEITNVKPSDKPIQEAKALPKPPPPKPEVKPTPPPPAPKPEPKPDTKEGFNPDQDGEPIKKEPKKEEPKKEEKKDKADQQQDFEKLLNDLKKDAQPVKDKANDKTAQEANKTQSDAPYDASQPLSLSEQDALRSAYVPCWSPPVGAKDADKLLVVIRAQYNPDGSLIAAKLDDSQKSKYNSDPFFRAAADAGLQAVNHPRCNPLKNLPTDIYPKLKDTKITFDPRLMAQ